MYYTFHGQEYDEYRSLDPGKREFQEIIGKFVPIIDSLLEPPYDGPYPWNMFEFVKDHMDVVQRVYNRPITIEQIENTFEREYNDLFLVIIAQLITDCRNEMGWH